MDKIKNEESDIQYKSNLSFPIHRVSLRAFIHFSFEFLYHKNTRLMVLLSMKTQQLYFSISSICISTQSDIVYEIQSNLSIRSPVLSNHL